MIKHYIIIVLNYIPNSINSHAGYPICYSYAETELTTEVKFRTANKFLDRKTTMFGVLLVLMGCLAFHADAGTNFIYWGGVCSGSAGSKIIYRGWAAKTPTNKKGGGATYLCLPSNPQWHATVPGIQGKNSLIVGTEFHHDGLGSLIPNSKWDHADIPCTACVVPAASQQIMIPGIN